VPAQVAGAGPVRPRLLRPDEVDQDRWCEFAADAELEYSQDFVRYASAVGAGDGLILVAEQSGRYAGALQATWVTARTPYLSRPALVLSEAFDDPAVRVQYEEHMYPALAVRNLSDARPHLASWAPPGTGRLLVEWVAQVAQDRGARSVSFLNVSSDDTELAELLSAANFVPALYTADAVIDIAGAADLDEYLCRLPRRRRAHARNEISLFHRSGLAIRQVTPGELPGVVRQEAATWAKYGSDVGFDALWRLREPLAAALAGRCRLIGCDDRAGEMLASAVHLIGRHRYHCFTYGSRPGAPSGCYAMLTFYEPIRYAADGALEQIMLGTTSLRAKLLRGARVRAVSAYTLACTSSGRRYYDQLAERLSRHVRHGLPELAAPTGEWL
jgi:Acetyltransferase (GNAT) domain